MKTQELIAELVRRGGGELPVAKAMRKPTFQSTLHRLVNGDTTNLRRPTAQRIADHFGLPIETFYSERLAAQALEELLGKPLDSPPPKSTLVTELVDKLAVLMDALGSMERELIAQRFAVLAQAPDSLKARQALAEALNTPTKLRKAA